MMFWRSVVGKLWFTILLLVTFVLFILTVMLLEFFDNYHVKQMEDGLTKTASQISKIIENHDEHDKELGLEIAMELVDSVSSAVVIKDINEYYYSPNTTSVDRLPVSYLMSEKDLSKVFQGKQF